VEIRGTPNVKKMIEFLNNKRICWAEDRNRFGPILGVAIKPISAEPGNESVWCAAPSKYGAGKQRNALVDFGAQGNIMKF